jgi:hypothetical protein
MVISQCYVFNPASRSVSADAKFWVNAIYYFENLKFITFNI